MLKGRLMDERPFWTTQFGMMASAITIYNFHQMSSIPTRLTDTSYAEHIANVGIAK